MICSISCQAAELASEANRDQWTGTWQTYWRGGGAIVRMQQTGQEVTGTIPLYDGTLSGALEDGRLRGLWSEESGRRGEFLFILAPDGQAFMGRFGSGEWWTGTRLSALTDYLARPADLSSPRETLRSFINAANSAREGFLEEIQPALDAIDFSQLDSARSPDGALIPQERIAYARELFRVLDALTFRLWGLPAQSEPGSMEEDSVTVTLSQAGTAHTFDLRFLKRGDDWLIDPPPKEDLDAALRQLYARHGGDPPAENDHLLLRNPRDTFRTFFEEMRRLGLGGRTNVLRTLDTESFQVRVEEEEALLLADYLKHVLDHIGFIVYQEIPNNPDRGDAYIYFRHAAGNIVVAPFPTPEGEREWRFTAETLHHLRPLYAAIEDMPQETSIREGRRLSAYFVVREALRGTVPRLLHPWGPMEAWQWLSLALFLVVSILISAAAAGSVLWLLRRKATWAAAFSSRRAQGAVAWPLRCTFIGLLWYFEINMLGLPEIVAGSFRRLAGTVAIGSAVWLIYRGLSVAATYSSRKIGTAGQAAVITSLSFGIIRILIFVAAALLLANVWSIPYSGVLAGLGIGGLAFALAAQPTLQNMIAGFTLFADSPLSVGDFCRYGEKLGTVEEIGLRSTRIRSLERTVVSIPNSEFANLQLENFSKRDRMLFQATLQLRYETTCDQLRWVLAELRRLLIAHPRVHPDPARVRFAGFGAHSLDLEVFAYVQTRDYNENLAIREDVLLRMMQIVIKSGTGFAFPSQVNYLARDTGLNAASTREAEEIVAAWRENSALPFPEFSPDEIRQLDGRLDYPPQGSPQSAVGKTKGT